MSTQVQAQVQAEPPPQGHTPPRLSVVAVCKEVFTPNGVISKKVASMIVGFTIVIGLVAWWFSPWKVLPSPLEVLKAFGPLWKSGIAVDLFSSLRTIGIAVAWTCIISFFFGYGSLLPALRPTVSFVSKLRFLSWAGLTIIFTLAARNGRELKVSLEVFAVTVFMVTNMAHVVRTIPNELYDHAKTLRMGPWERTWYVVVRGTLPDALDCLRANTAIGWMMLTMVEGIVRSEGGIGTVLLNSNKQWNLSAVYAIQIMVLVIGLCIDAGFGVMSRKFCPYAFMKVERK